MKISSLLSNPKFYLELNLTMFGFSQSFSLPKNPFKLYYSKEAYHKWQVWFSFIYLWRPFSQKFLKGVSEIFCVAKNSMPKRGKRERNFSLHFCNYGMGCESKLENNRIEIEVKHKRCVIEKKMLIVKQAMVFNTYLVN